jgi:hypothetical protein
VSYEVVEAQTFWDCVDSMRRDDEFKGDLDGHPHRAPAFSRSRTPSCRPTRWAWVPTARRSSPPMSVAARATVASIWQLFNKTIVVLLYGTHAVQDRAKRMRIGFDDGERVVTIYEKTPDSAS